MAGDGWVGSFVKQTGLYKNIFYVLKYYLLVQTKPVCFTNRKTTTLKEVGMNFLNEQDSLSIMNLRAILS